VFMGQGSVRYLADGWSHRLKRRGVVVFPNRPRSRAIISAASASAIAMPAAAWRGFMLRDSIRWGAPRSITFLCRALRHGYV
jgi:hypothetical protein